MGRYRCWKDDIFLLTLSSYQTTMSILHSNDNARALFEAIARGDEDAFKELFELYRVRVYAVAFKWTKLNFSAEEITQDVFISIWTGRAQLAAVSDPRAYIYTIVYNKVSRHLKKEANKARILKLSLWNAKEYSNETEETVYANDGQKFVNRAVAKLSPRIKVIYELKRVEGKSYHEIAETLHLSPHTVKSHLLKAIKFIRNYVRDNALLLVCLLAALLS